MKVFGIGFQRTGNTSLWAALNMLGISTVKFPKQLYYDPDHPILNRYEGFTDNPIPLLYQKLDRRFPGSRFILTVREEQSWLKSVEWLYTIGAIKFYWNERLETDEIHQALYGATNFDPKIFLERYRQHNRSAVEYFADRPGDLLVMEIHAGDGFAKLCPFLGLPAPRKPFPRRNRSEPLWRVNSRVLFKKLKTSWKNLF